MAQAIKVRRKKKTSKPAKGVLIKKSKSTTPKKKKALVNMMKNRQL